MCHLFANTKYKQKNTNATQYRCDFAKHVADNFVKQRRGGKNMCRFVCKRKYAVQKYKYRSKYNANPTPRIDLVVPWLVGPS